MGRLAGVLVAGLVAAIAWPAAGASPSLPPFDRAMTLKQVEPHVVRVLDDGAGHDLTDPETFEDLKPVSLLAAGDDGSVWMTSNRGFIKIGMPGEVRDPLGTFLAQMEIGPDGALWIADVYQGTTSSQQAQGSIGRWHEGAWSIHRLPTEARVVWLDAREDGGLDFAWRDETSLTFGALEPGAESWTPASMPPLALTSPDGFMAVEHTPERTVVGRGGSLVVRGATFRARPAVDVRGVGLATRPATGRPARAAHDAAGGVLRDVAGRLAGGRCRYVEAGCDVAHDEARGGWPVVGR